MRFTPHLAPRLAPNGAFSANYKFLHCGPHFIQLTKHAQLTQLSRKSYRSVLAPSTFSLSTLCSSVDSLPRLLPSLTHLTWFSFSLHVCCILIYFNIVAKQQRSTKERQKRRQLSGSLLTLECESMGSERD